jgi:hypothetical protein
MLWVKLVDQFPRIPGILYRFSASLCLGVTRPQYDVMELPVASLKVEDSVDFAFITVVDDRQVRLKWRLAGGRTYIVVE